MKRRSFLQLMAALAGLPFLPKTAAKPLTFINGQPVGPPPIPVGHVSPFYGETIPPGWLPCDGRWISFKEYPELCAIMGEPYKLPKLTPQPLMHAVPDSSEHENLCGYHGEPTIELLPYQYIVKAK